MKTRNKIIMFCCSLLFVSLLTNNLVADECEDLPDDLCGIGTGSDHVSHSGYVCTSYAHNETHEDFDDVKTIDKVWDEGDLNCGCYPADVTYTIERSRTNTNNANIGGSYSGSVSATVGGNLAGLCKAEATATATWEASAGWGVEATHSETLTAASNFQAMLCSEWSYKKWYWKGTVDGTADLYRHWIDDLQCAAGGGLWYYHEGLDTGDGEITAYGRGWELYDGEYDGEGGGFQNWDVRCEKCGTSTFCYKYECPGECGPPCDD